MKHHALCVVVIGGCCFAPTPMLVPMPEPPPAPIAASTDTLPPIEISTVAVVHASGSIDVLDVEAARFAHFTRSDALALSTGSSAWISPLGWSPSRSAFVLLRSSFQPGVGNAIVSLAADGTSETLLDDSGVPAEPLASAWIEAQSAVACLVQAESGVTSFRRALDAPAETQAWSDGADLDGPFAIAADGSRVLFADACEAELTGVCLFTSGLDGAERTLVGHVTQHVCSIALSADGHHAILAQSVAPDPACTRLTTLDLDTRVLRGAYDMGAADLGSLHGVTSMALSADGARFAVLSDEGHGCVSGGGFTSCQLRISARRFDLSRTWTPDMPALDDGRLVWIH